jgi:tripartite-type tricarboxylate transporter receptor subunit TctC
LKNAPESLNSTVANPVLTPNIKDRFQSLDMTPAPSTPEELDKMLAEQIAMFSKLVKDIGLRSK